MPSSPPNDGPSAAQARQQAAHILAGYHHPPGHNPEPLAGVLHAIGRGLATAFDPVGRFLLRHVLHPVGAGFRLAFGSWWPLALVVLAVLLGAAASLLLISRRSRPRSVDRHAPVAAGVPEDPGRLEAEALAAETAGDFEAAVRLRFRAGLARLERQGLLVDREFRTDRQLARQLGSVTFDSLATQHEAIVFAGRSATEADVSEARHRWPLVADEARRAAHEVMA